MATIIARERGTTVPGQWTKVFAAAEGAFHDGVNIRALRNGSTEVLSILVIPKDTVPPSNTDPILDWENYHTNPGETYPLGVFADHNSDIYVRGGEDGQVAYLATRLKGRMA